MTFQVGRVTLNEPMDWDSTGNDTVAVTGSYKATSLTDGLVKRDQLLSLVDNRDEPVVPVILTGEPRVTGYYRVLNAQLMTDVFTRQQGNLYDYRLDLQRVQGFTQPLMESVISGALLTNAVGAVVGDRIAFHAVPGTAIEYGQATGAPTIATRSSADGNVYFNWACPISTTVSFGLTPTNFYVGAATIEQGSPLQPVVGRILAQADVVNWRLSNGIVRVTPNASPGTIDVAHWTGAAWVTAKTYGFTTNAGAPTVNGFSSLTILRNSIEECTVRLSCLTTAAFGTGGRVAIDLSLRRGDRLVRGYLVTTVPQQSRIKRITPEAATAITYGAVTLGGFRATANDGDGNRYVMFSYQSATTSDLTNGYLTLNAPNPMDFGIGSEIAGSGAVAPNDAVSLAGEYLAAQSESQRVVAR